MASGPLVQVGITGQNTVMIAGIPPLTVHASMMIDTGAERTVIDDRIAQALGLTPIRFENMVGVSGIPELCPVYPVNIDLGFEDAHGHVLRCDFKCDAIGMNPQASLHQGLIGRDFLSHFELHYNGPTNSFEVIIPKAVVASVAPPPPPATPRPKTTVERQAQKQKRKEAQKSKRRNRH